LGQLTGAKDAMAAIHVVVCTSSFKLWSVRTVKRPPNSHLLFGGVGCSKQCSKEVNLTIVVKMFVSSSPFAIGFLKVDNMSNFQIFREIAQQARPHHAGKYVYQFTVNCCYSYE
jgi:hypothetical protein